MKFHRSLDLINLDLLKKKNPATSLPSRARRARPPSSSSWEAPRRWVSASACSSCCCGQGSIFEEGEIYCEEKVKENAMNETCLSRCRSVSFRSSSRSFRSSSLSIRCCFFSVFWCNSTMGGSEMSNKQKLKSGEEYVVVFGERIFFPFRFVFFSFFFASLFAVSRARRGKNGIENSTRRYRAHTECVRCVCVSVCVGGGGGGGDRTASQRRREGRRNEERKGEECLTPLPPLPQLLLLRRRRRCCRRCRPLLHSRPPRPGRP